MAAVQGALANIWDGKGMRRVLEQTQQIIDRLSGAKEADTGQPDDLSGLRKVFEQCQRVPQVR